MLKAVGFRIKLGTKFHLHDVGDFDGFEGLGNNKTEFAIAIDVINVIPCASSDRRGFAGILQTTGFARWRCVWHGNTRCGLR